jgi:trigger factor
VKISTQSTENRQAILNIEVEPEEMERSLKMAYHRLVKRVNIPGFRKGKAPQSVLERYIGKEELKEEALEHLIPQLCSQAIEEQKMEVIAQPQVEILQVDPVVFKATFPLRPSVELGDYHNIRLTPQKVEVSEEQIDNVVEQLREQHAVWSPVERPVGFGDLATIDIEDKGEGQTYQGRQFPVIQDSPLFLPGFAEHLVGMEKGEERDFCLSYPDVYEVKELAGKQYDFKVKLIEVKEKHLPELNDEFVKSLGGGLENVAALRGSIAPNMKNIAEERAREEFEQKVVEAVVDRAKVEVPPILVEQGVDRLLSERESMFGGKKGVEDYLKNLNKTQEELKEELHPVATKQLIQGLVLGKVAQEEKIEVRAADTDAEIENLLKNAGEKGEELQRILGTEQGRGWVGERLTIRKAVQRLVEIATSDVGEEKG